MRAADVAALSPVSGGVGTGRWADPPAPDGAISVCLGMSFWKRSSVRRFLLPEGPVFFRRSAKAAVAEAARRRGRVVVWAAKEPEDLARHAAQAGVPLLRMEDGFLRSVGLGAAFAPALSYVVDSRGIHLDPSRPSDLEVMIERGAFPPEMLARARDLAAAIAASRVTKYNVGRAPSEIGWPDAGRVRILVPGQVEDDVSVKRGARLVRRNGDLLAAVRAANPNAFIVFKPHPDVEQGFRRGRVPAAALARYADAVASGVDSGALLPLVDEVHTMTSLLGFEALLRGRRVVAYGQPFYAGWGLTTDLDPPLRRLRRATLDEVVAAALILYPRYLDPRTGSPCGPEVALECIAARDLWRRRGSIATLRALQGRMLKALSSSRAEARP